MRCEIVELRKLDKKLFLLKEKFVGRPGTNQGT